MGKQLLLPSACLALLLRSASLVEGASPYDLISGAETRRIEMIERVSPSVVCVYDKYLRGGGSGVLIDARGYGLTNYHVIAGMMETRRGWGGLGDGILYELEVLGIDVTGDLAMFRLIPPRSDYRFPFARLGDSEAVRVGDTAFALGNPFILSEDYSPTVTMGLVTGVHRYQWGVKGNLTYSDCIQIDAPINPGNSGGPLFNASGEIIGINGRISVNTRGRFNVGFGYAIAARQIQRFMPALRAGLLAYHGEWHARVEDLDGGGIGVSHVRAPGPAHDAGLRVGDQLLSLGGVEIQSANQVVSLLGTYPAGWPITAVIERDRKSRGHVVHLDEFRPPMRQPFQPSREVNLQAVRRVLGEYRRRTLDDSAAEFPGQVRCTVTREHRATSDRAGKACETYEMTFPEEGRAILLQWNNDRSNGRAIEFDAHNAVQRATDADEGFELPLDQKMIVGSISLLKEWLSKPVEDLDLSDLSHIGGSAFLSRPEENAGAGESARPIFQGERIVEVIEARVAEQAAAWVAFDAESFVVLRIVARDRFSGTEVTLDLSDHRDLGRIYWPTTVEVYGKGIDYRDTLSDWEIRP